MDRVTFKRSVASQVVGSSGGVAIAVGGSALDARAPGKLGEQVAGAAGAVGQGHVDRDAVQPGGEVGIAAEGVELTDDLQEHILGDVLGVGVVAEHSPREVVDARGVVAEDPFRGQ